MADTNIPDPTCYFDCLVDKPFVRMAGVTKQLPLLPGGTSAFAYAINEDGSIIGSGQAAAINPLTGVSILHAMLWKDELLLDLGTLCGNTNNPFAVNDRDEVVGASTNGVSDPYANTPMPTCHAIETSVCPDATFALHRRSP